MDSSLALGACDWLYGGVVWPVLISGMLVVTSCVPFHATHRFVYAVHSGSLASNHLQL